MGSIESEVSTHKYTSRERHLLLFLYISLELKHCFILFICKIQPLTFRQHFQISFHSYSLPVWLIVHLGKKSQRLVGDKKGVSRLRCRNRIFRGCNTSKGHSWVSGQDLRHYHSFLKSPQKVACLVSPSITKGCFKT